MSKNLDVMLKQGLGFRTEDFSGSGIRSLKDVVYYEIRELGNTDILDTMSELYGLNFKPYMDVEDENVVADESYHEILELIFSFLEKHFNTSRDNLNAIWLTTYENVQKIYAQSPYYQIDMIYIKDDFFPISDLGTDGTLFVYKKLENSCNPIDKLHLF